MKTKTLYETLRDEVYDKKETELKIYDATNNKSYIDTCEDFMNTKEYEAIKNYIVTTFTPTMLMDKAYTIIYVEDKGL